MPASRHLGPQFLAVPGPASTLLLILARRRLIPRRHRCECIARLRTIHESVVVLDGTTEGRQARRPDERVRVPRLEAGCVQGAGHRVLSRDGVVGRWWARQRRWLLFLLWYPLLLLLMWLWVGHALDLCSY